MAVYVDNSRIPFRNMVMCHMVADSSAELLEMADSIGVQRRWIQRQGTYREHFDVCLAKRRLAVDCGAIEVGMGQLARILAKKRGGGGDVQ